MTRETFTPLYIATTENHKLEVIKTMHIQYILMEVRATNIQREEEEEEEEKGGQLQKVINSQNYSKINGVAKKYANYPELVNNLNFQHGLLH